ncbi:unnamed protein product [Caenorhabditis angaria]|uniref:Uncharacterized protein n=1 Tax=Caenorhabditis angaria TaxID=860376 RepID=A0A9P1J1W9_9PELO|nr:unnamed protein product [Caenorhabditis angaria]
MMQVCQELFVTFVPSIDTQTNNLDNAHARIIIDQFLDDFPLCKVVHFGPNLASLLIADRKFLTAIQRRVPRIFLSTHVDERNGPLKSIQKLKNIDLSSFLAEKTRKPGDFLLSSSYEQWFKISEDPRYFHYFLEKEGRFLNCDDFSNESGISEYVKNGRLRLSPEKMLGISMDCENLKARIQGKGDFRVLDRPMAFVRNINTLYELQEMFLFLNYHPDNTYCFSIDEKSSELYEKIEKLSNCFPENIFINSNTYDFDSAGNFQDEAHLKCLELIMDRNWYHAALLQNNDMIIKSTEQLSNLSEMLNYTSLMGLEFPNYKRFRKSPTNWTPKILHLFKNESGVPLEVLKKPLKLRKSKNQLIVSKTFIKSIFKNLDLTDLLEMIKNQTNSEVDEILFPTLYSNYLGLKGQMVSKCVDSYVDTVTDEKCGAKLSEQGSCIVGVEHLAELGSANNVLVSKVLENFDLAPVICMRKMIEDEKTTQIEEPALHDFPQYREMVLKRVRAFDKESFKC